VVNATETNYVRAAILIGRSERSGTGSINVRARNNGRTYSIIEIIGDRKSFYNCCPLIRRKRVFRTRRRIDRSTRSTRTPPRLNPNNNVVIRTRERPRRRFTYRTLLGNNSTMQQNKIGSVSVVNPSKMLHIISAWISFSVNRISNEANIGTPQLMTWNKFKIFLFLSGLRKMLFTRDGGRGRLYFRGRLLSNE